MRSIIVRRLSYGTENSRVNRGLTQHRQTFRDRRFAREDLRLPDVDNAEFILIGARTDPERAYDLDLESAKTAHPRAKAIAGLRLPRTGTPIKPLFEGMWE